MQYPVIVGANGIRPLMIQVHSPIYGTMTFVIHVIGVYAHNLNGYFLAMGECKKNGEWLKKGECHSPLPTISCIPKTFSVIHKMQIQNRMSGVNFN